MHVELCICDEIRPMMCRTRLLIVMHRREAKKSTNSGQLAAQCLRNSTTVVRGNRDEPADLSELNDPARRVLVLFPADGAQLLSASLLAGDPRPVTLVVPDNT